MLKIFKRFVENYEIKFLVKHLFIKIHLPEDSFRKLVLSIFYRIFRNINSYISKIRDVLL